MKLKYKNYLKENGISDYLQFLRDYPYSCKYAVVMGLLQEFTSEQVNQILYEYKQKYIDLKRVEYKIVLNHCKSIGRRKFSE